MSLSSHLVTDARASAESVLQTVRARLTDGFGIDHTTIQIEPTGSPGDDPACADACEPVGHAP